jgi:uncharacterized membrane protein YfcA
VDVHQLLIAFAVGAVVGLASGAFGKGGSAIATPLLAAFGIPPIVAVASPLPATIPATAIAGRAYGRSGFVNGRVVLIGIAIGLPLAALGALVTRWVPGEPLVVASEVLVLGLALRMLVGRERHGEEPDADASSAEATTGRVVVTVAAVALVSGLLANSGGFLLAPLFVTFLRLPLKEALGTSLAISVALAIPGTVVHAVLGHIDWSLTIAFGLASVPFARLGAQLSLRAGARNLARTYGVVLATVAGSALMLAR